MKNKILIGVMSVAGIGLMLSSLFIFIKREVGGFDLFNSGIDECTPYNVFVSKGEQEYSVEISWQTKGMCLGYVQYGKDSNSLDLIGVDLVNDVNAKEHTVVLEKLLTKQKYFFVVRSEDVTYGFEGIPLEFKIADL
jgi:hypothetical protein